MKYFIQNVLFYIRRYMRDKPDLFNKVYGLNKHYRNNLLVNSDTKLVLEGYPRSANTHCVYLLEYVTNGKLKIAHHMHNEAQIVNAFQKGIDVVVVVRDPLESVISMVMRERFLSPRQSYNYYIEFYEFLNLHRDKIKIYDFKEVIEEPEKFVREVLFKAYGENIDFSLPEENVYLDGINRLNEIDKGDALSLSLPTEEKKHLKNRVKDEVISDENLIDLRLKAKNLYDQVR